MARITKTKAMQQAQGPQEFTLPHKFSPRSYQRELFVAFEQGIKRFVLNWHRRSGKDRACLNLMALSMAYRPGLYLYIYPTKELARAALWIALHKGGKFLDAFPEAWRDGEPNNTEMLIRLQPLPGQATGSIFKLTGADDPDSLRGLNPVGTVLSEFSQHKENVWQEILSPIVNENDGWIVFNGTPQGKNHFYDIYQTAVKHPERWFVSTKTVEDTRRDAPGEDGSPVVPLARIQADMEEGIAPEIVRQESYCSFDGFRHGSLFGDCLQQARDQKRIRPLVRSANDPVGVMFDIGLSDGTAAIFYQTYGQAYQIIDYEFTQGKDHTEWWKLLTDKPYVYGRICLPHDTAHEHFGQEQTTFDFFQRKFRCPVIKADKLPVQQGIAMVRGVFSKLEFDTENCEEKRFPNAPSLLECLGAYHRKWDDAKKDFSGEPVHDIHSHAADALRTGVVAGLDGLHEAPPVTWTHAEMYFDLFRHDRPREREAETAFDLFARR